LVKDIEAKEELMSTALELLESETAQEGLIKNITALGKPNATVEIVNELEKIV
jgi:hypothetical protein